MIAEITTPVITDHTRIFDHPDPQLFRAHDPRCFKDFAGLQPINIVTTWAYCTIDRVNSSSEFDGYFRQFLESTNSALRDDPGTQNYGTGKDSTQSAFYGFFSYVVYSNWGHCLNIIYNSMRDLSLPLEFFITHEIEYRTYPESIFAGFTGHFPLFSSNSHVAAHHLEKSILLGYQQEFYPRYYGINHYPVD